MAPCPAFGNGVEGLGKGTNERETPEFSHKGQSSPLTGAIWVPRGVRRAWGWGTGGHSFHLPAPQMLV